MLSHETHNENVRAALKAAVQHCQFTTLSVPIVLKTADQFLNYLNKHTINDNSTERHQQ